MSYHPVGLIATSQIGTQPLSTKPTTTVFGTRTAVATALAPATTIFTPIMTAPAPAPAQATASAPLFQPAAPAPVPVTAPAPVVQMALSPITTETSGPITGGLKTPSSGGGGGFSSLPFIPTPMYLPSTDDLMPYVPAPAPASPGIPKWALYGGLAVGAFLIFKAIRR